MIVYCDHGDHTSPLASIESDIVKTLVQMARTIHHCISPPQVVYLINSSIKGTEVQQHLIEFKGKYSHDERGKIGVGYWSAFKKRHATSIISKPGQ